MENFPDMSRVIDLTEYMSGHCDSVEECAELYQEATEFLEFYIWCEEILESYVGMFYPGILAIFLFRIRPSKPDIDEWVWVVVGDLPPTYLTVDDCPSPAAALDGYIGAMGEWVAAAREGKSVSGLIPVNVLATKENAELLANRLRFLDSKILSKYKDDLIF